MLETKTTSPIPYLVQLSGVREVSLVGVADLDYWRERLEREGLSAADVGGMAQVQLCACEGRFFGVRFREFSVSVRVTDGDGFFLVHAYNSVRFFAFVERVLYRTPYYHGHVYVSARRPAYVDLASPGGHFWATTPPGDPEEPPRPVRREPDGWEGAVYLPRRSAKPGELFYARLAGDTITYPFDEDRDLMKLAPSGPGVLKDLADSGFRATQWVLRPDATHSKSRTVSRNAQPEGQRRSWFGGQRAGFLL